MHRDRNRFHHQALIINNVPVINPLTVKELEALERVRSLNLRTENIENGVNKLGTWAVRFVWASYAPSV